MSDHGQVRGDGCSVGGRGEDLRREHVLERLISPTVNGVTGHETPQADPATGEPAMAD